MAIIVQYELYQKADGSVYEFIVGGRQTKSHAVRINTGFRYALLCGQVIPAGAGGLTTHYNLVKDNLCKTCASKLEKEE